LPELGAILPSLRYEGLCCFNYKMDNGVLVVLELNPRFGGSLPHQQYINDVVLIL